MTLGLAVALSGCAPSAPAEHAPSPLPAARPADPPAIAASRPPPEDPTTHEAHLIARTLRRVEAARGLRATRPVPGVLLDRSALIARVRDHVARELPPAATQNEGLELQLFGFLPTRFDYEAAEYKLLQDQLAGYYEPADGTMYMANDLGDDEAGATLAHELVHALQDQHWNLGERARYRPGEGDRSEAVSALAEGDATSAMFDVMIGKTAPSSGKTAVDVPDDVFVDQIRQGMNEGPSAGAPRIMRSSLAAPYIYGTLFVHQLRRRGGWAAVNDAWDHAPTTTEQMLHPDKWLAGEPALPVPPPTFSALGSGWKAVDEDSEGELGVRLAFEEWMPAATAASASADWGGDRGVLVTRGDRAAFAWVLRYDRSGANRSERAQFAFSSVRAGLEQSLGRAAVSAPSFVCHERADRGPLAVEQRDESLVFVLGPANAGADAWTSAGDCDLARRWAREIATARPSR